MKRHRLETHAAVLLAGLCLVLTACLNESTPAETGGKKSGTSAGGRTAGSGGSSATGKGGAGGVSSSSTSGGSAGSGGVAGSGGSARSGGSSGSGGSLPAGGTTSVGGSRASGGDVGSGGSGSDAADASPRDVSPDRMSDTIGPSGGRARDASGTGGVAAGGSGGQATGGAGGTALGGTTGSSTIADGCLDDLAKGITISEIAVFQAGKISVMKNGTAVTPKTAQGGEIVQGKDALFRLYVAADSGFKSRDLSARLMLNGQTMGYYAKTTISSSSTELSAANSFNILVPGAAITDRLDYRVEIVECDTGTGTDHGAVFPASGVASLATLKTGAEKLTVVPVTSGTATPTLDQAFADSLKAYMDSMYPTSGTVVTLSSTAVKGCNITAATATDGTAWEDCLYNLLDRRRSDKPANDVYYVGVLQPTSSFSAYCPQSCIMGVSPVATVANASYRVSLIVGYSPYYQSTAAHELGHAHGLEHSPGCSADSPDRNFPYVTSGKAMIGWVGWDKQQTSVKFLDPAKYTDIMAYCSPQWVSDYVYNELADRIMALSSSSIVTGPARTWRMLIEGASGVLRWAAPITDPSPAEGEPVAAPVVDARGNTVAEATVYRTRTSLGGAFYMVPDPQPGWVAIVIHGRSLAF